MLQTFIEKLGGRFIRKLVNGQKALRFAMLCLRQMCRPGNYNPAMREVLTMQIYFTAVQVLLPFVFLSIVFGSFVLDIILEKIKEMGLTEYLGDILTGIIFVEIAPLLTVFWIAVRSSSAINAEIAAMTVHNEIKTLRYFGIDPVIYLFIPRIISTMFCTLIFDILFSIIIFFGGSLFSYGILGIAHEQYTAMFLEAIGFSDIALIFAKLLAFGFFLAFIPIHNGSRISSHQLTDIPISVLSGMVRVFIAILVIELCSLTLKFV